MYEELKRRYYVTPTNYVELVKGYVHLLEEKQKEIGNEKMKLTSGLFKLEEASRNSEELAIKLNKSKGELSNKQKECEDLLIKI
jgi:dynein heavy chain